MNGQQMAQQGNTQAFWENVPDSFLIPEGKILFAIESAEETFSNSGKLMMKLGFVAQEPSEVRGQKHTEYYVIGSDADPMAQNPQTWRESIAVRRLKDLLTKAQVPLASSVGQTFAAARGALVICKMLVQTDNDKNSQYYGREQNRMSTTYKVGETQPMLDPVTPAAPMPPTQMMPPGGMPAAPMQVPQQMAASAPPQPVQMPQQMQMPQQIPAAQLGQPVQFQQPAQFQQPVPPAPPVQQPVQQPVQMQPQMQQPQPTFQNAPVIGAPEQGFTQEMSQVPASGPTMTCPICQSIVAQSGFAEHMMECQQRAAAHAMQQAG